MPADRLLVTLLRNLQTHTEQQDTPRLLSTASSLLSTLSNPLNLTLLTAQLLSAPAIWTRPDGLSTCLRCMGTFQAAAMAVLRHEQEARETRDRKVNSLLQATPPSTSTNLSREEWVKAIILGADERSPRWSHVMVLAGLLIGFEAQDRMGMSPALRRTVEGALVTAVNLALDDAVSADELGGQCLALILNYSFDVLSDVHRERLDHDRLLPVLVGSAFFSVEGYHSGYFLGPIEPGVSRNEDGMLSWPQSSPSFKQISAMSSRPLVASMGPLSRLIAFSAEHANDWRLLPTILDDIADFSRRLLDQWRHTKISEIDASQETLRFQKETLEATLPVLWRLLRSVLFATSIVVRGILGRALGDGRLAAGGVAPHLASQSLHTLRNLYFISSRLSVPSLSQHTFVYLTAIDLLTPYPTLAENFIRDIQPAFLGSIPTHPLDRSLDLFFLNTAEHFTLALSSTTNEDVLIAAAAPYLSAPITEPESLKLNSSLLELFEAAHALTLAVLSSPQSAGTASKHLPFYIDALFRTFPHSLSARQFRLAFRTLITICSPPSPLAAAHPQMAETLLEVLHQRAWTQPSALRPAPYSAPNPDAGVESTQTTPASPTEKPAPAAQAARAGSEEGLDEGTALTLTLIDCLPALPPALLREWLPLAAALVPRVEAPADRQRCRERFWEVLTGGDMDVERSRVCVGWWATQGGREAVLYAGESVDGALMSGALGGGGSGGGLSGESKL